MVDRFNWLDWRFGSAAITDIASHSVRLRRLNTARWDRTGRAGTDGVVEGAGRGGAGRGGAGRGVAGRGGAGRGGLGRGGAGRDGAGRDGRGRAGRGKLTVIVI